MKANRHFLSLFLCLALAVNLLAPFASAHSLFMQICTSHGIVLVPSEGASDPGMCEMCPVSYADAMLPAASPSRAAKIQPVAYDANDTASVAFASIPDRHARSPPISSV